MEWSGKVDRNSYLHLYEIVYPENFKTFHTGDAITFSGIVSSGDDNYSDNDFVWTSDLDGQFGVGRSFDSNSLSEGVHEITLTVHNNTSQFSTDKIRISIVSEKAVTGTVFVGNGPAYIAVSPNGAYLYVANNDDNTIMQIRSSDQSVVNTIAVGSFPVSIAVSPGNDLIYVSNFYDNTVLIIDASMI